MSRNNERFDRRTLLKTIGSTAVAGIALGATSGAAAAVETDDRLARAYSDERRLKIAFQQHGEDLRTTLVDEGFVSEDFDFGALSFDIDESATGLDPTDEDHVAGVTSTTQEGTTTAFASVSTSSDTHEISLFVQPERDKAYALVESKASGERVMVFDSDVSPAGCLKDKCTSDSCSTCYSVRETYDCGDDCQTNCTLVDTNCDCKSCSCDDRAWCTTECSYC